MVEIEDEQYENPLEGNWLNVLTIIEAIWEGTVSILKRRLRMFYQS